MGKFSGDENYLKEAESIFKELGTKFDCLQAKKFLALPKSQTVP
jgi:hypothetical protein